MPNLFDIIILVIYATLGILLIFNFLSSKFKWTFFKDRKHRVTASSRNVPLSKIRNQYFPNEIPSNDFFITSYMEETFNIFIRLAPSMISTLSKAERRILAIKSGIDNPQMSAELLESEIDLIEVNLNEMIKVSHLMIEKLEAAVSNEHSESVTTSLDASAVKAYMDSVNVLVDLTDNHATINFETHCRLVDKYPALVERFRVISSKFTYLLYVNLISYSNRIDQNIFIYV